MKNLYMLKDRGSANTGLPGGLSSATPIAPVALPAIDTGKAVKIFSTYYNQNAKDPVVSPFVKVFPNL